MLNYEIAEIAENCSDLKPLNQIQKYYLKSRYIDIYNCLPIRLRGDTEEDKQEYINKWGYSPLLKPKDDGQRENTKELIMNVLDYNEDYERLGKIGTVKKVLDNFCYLIKWMTNDLECIDQNIDTFQYQYSKQRINNLCLRTSNKSIQVFKFDSYLLLFSFDALLFVYSINDSGRSSRILVQPSDRSVTNSKHFYKLIDSLYEIDLLCGYIHNDFKIV